MEYIIPAAYEIVVAVKAFKQNLACKISKGRV